MLLNELAKRLEQSSLQEPDLEYPGNESKSPLPLVETENSKVEEIESFEPPVDLDSEELPIKRRHCSWAGIDFRFQPVELVKPIPIRPSIDSNFLLNRQESDPCATPRPSSASSGIFDLDSASEGSRREGDSTASTELISSADERRPSDEEIPRVTLSANRSFARHSRRSHTKTSANRSGFLPLKAGDANSSVCSSSSSSSSTGIGDSALWQSAPDLNDNSLGLRRRKRHYSGITKPRPSIDLFKNTTDDDSCGGDSLVSSKSAERCFPRGLGHDDDLNTDSDDSQSVTVSSVSTLGTFNTDSCSNSEQQNTVTRSLSYPHIRSYDLCDENPKVDTSRCRFARKLVDDGLRTVVGSPADMQIPSRIDGRTPQMSTAPLNLINLVPSDVPALSCCDGIAGVEPQKPELDTPPKLIDGPVIFVEPYADELDIDLIEQN